MLKVDARQSVIVIVAAVAGLIAAIVSIDQLVPGSSILLSVIAAVGAIAWVTARAHQFLALSAPRIGDELLSDDDCWPDRVEEESFIEIEVVVGEPADAAGVDWTCRSCGEENTREFGLCWKCGSGFTPEDV